MTYVLAFFGLVLIEAAILIAAVVVALVLRRDRRPAARVEITQFACDDQPWYWTTRMDTGHIVGHTHHEEVTR